MNDSPGSSSAGTWNVSPSCSTQTCWGLEMCNTSRAEVLKDPARSKPPVDPRFRAGLTPFLCRCFILALAIIFCWRKILGGSCRYFNDLCDPCRLRSPENVSPIQYPSSCPSRHRLMRSFHTAVQRKQLVFAMQKRLSRVYFGLVLTCE